MCVYVLYKYNMSFCLSVITVFQAYTGLTHTHEQLYIYKSIYLYMYIYTYIYG